MKKFVISSLIFILILLAAFAGIAWYFFASNGSSPALPGEVKQSEQIPTYEEMLKTKEESNKKDAATYNKAIIARNETMCDSISDANKKAECHDTIVAIQAEASGSLESCATITSTRISLQCRDSIYQDRAIKVGDKAFCGNVADEALGKHCREAIDEKNLQTMLEGGNATIVSCKALEVKFQDSCLASVKQNNDQEIYTKALASGDATICSQIQDSALRDTCSDTILLKHALSANSASDCDGIKDGTKRAYCTSHVETRNEAVLFKGYITSSNLTGCSTLTDVSLKDRCHDMVTLSLARTNKDASLCQTLTNTGMTALCQKSAQ